MTFAPLPHAYHRPSARPTRVIRRGFNFVELLIALAISAALLTATMVALQTSFIAYRKTTRSASSHTIGRLVMDRMQTLIRTSTEFGPRPVNPANPIVETDVIEFITSGETPQGIVIEWVENEEALYVRLFDPDSGTITSSHVLLGGVVAQFDEEGQRVRPFTLEYDKGRYLYRATIDLAVVPDDTQRLAVEGDEPSIIRLVGSAMPRTAAYSTAAKY